MRFTPKHTFHSDEFKSTYVQGLSYTVRPGNEKLAIAVKQWMAEGKVEHDMRGGGATMGLGNVSGQPAPKKPGVFKRIFGRK